MVRVCMQSAWHACLGLSTLSRAFTPCPGCAPTCRQVGGWNVSVRRPAVSESSRLNTEVRPRKQQPHISVGLKRALWTWFALSVVSGSCDRCKVECSILPFPLQAGRAFQKCEPDPDVAHTCQECYDPIQRAPPIWYRPGSSRLNGVAAVFTN